MVLALTIGCEDDNTTKPPPPPPSPQIAHDIYYTRTLDSGGQLTGLQDNDVFAVLAASDGTAWMGSAEGVTVYPNLNTTVRRDAFDNSNGLPNPKVRAIAEHAGKIYVGTWGGGVGVYDMTLLTWSTIPVSTNGLVNGLVANILVDGGLLYFGTNNGVSIHDPVADTWSTIKKRTQINGGPDDGQWKANGLLEPVISDVCVAMTTRGREEWFAGRVEFAVPIADLGLHGITVRREGNTDFLYQDLLRTGLQEANVNDIFFDDATGLFWIAYASRGISIVDVDASTWTRTTMLDGLPSDIVYAITKIDGVFWVATQRGIARRNTNGTWSGYGLSGGLKSDSVRLVYTDDGSKLWLAYFGAGSGRVLPNTAQ